MIWIYTHFLNRFVVLKMRFFMVYDRFLNRLDGVFPHKNQHRLKKDWYKEFLLVHADANLGK